ncbi:hypothetical protein BV22DRAFT_868345 [Leucogyrophana mollusca]|uniref:Uncharacterized protein n=1 Tax=Leucogyrophana mollusca TaxID=85980 RepID=A0ACB8B1M9_9AGAM|nr:hypothetical protein BV22DRAFT_868345 [Leucogyrophana mollusca]
MSSKAAFLGLLAATAGIASATHCTLKTMETGRWAAEFHNGAYCAGSLLEYFPPSPYSNSLDYEECTPCYNLGHLVSDHVQSFAFSAAKKSKISWWLADGTDCGGVTTEFHGGVAQNTTSSELRAASSFIACRGAR